jgi:pyruvate/2-oxoglutarate dehydrogenase complex dihydrolipoamide acyltransferase (E2) component
VDKLMALRKQINEALAAAGGAKLSVNDFVVKASALVRPPPCRGLRHHTHD